MLHHISRERQGRTATVDRFNAFLIGLRPSHAVESGVAAVTAGEDPAFVALVAGLLSVQTRDATALAAIAALRKHFNKPAGGGGGGGGGVGSAVGINSINNANGAFPAGDGDGYPGGSVGFNAETVARADLVTIEGFVKSCNFYSTKARNIKAVAAAVLHRTPATVPRPVINHFYNLDPFRMR